MGNLKMLKVEEVAEILSLSTHTIYDYIENGMLPSVRVGKRAVRISEKVLKNWLDRRPHMPSRKR